MGAITSWIVRRIRRSRYFPEASLNRVADADRLDDPIRAAVIVWFPTALDSIYQLRPWYHSLEQLHRAHRVLVICRDSRVSARIRAESSLDAISLETSAQLDPLLESSPAKVALYINLDPLDFDCLRFRSLAHVYVGHGDSDKKVFASNQVKAFDRYFVAGEAAVERLAADLMFYDASLHAVAIGQPQLDGAGLEWAVPTPGARARVVYAPTWEGAHPSVSYSSVISHGEAIVTSLLGAGHEVVYRPHPFTGREDPAFKQADLHLRKLVEGSGHTVDTSPDLRVAFEGASALVTDVSAVVSYWLPSRRPVLVTVPAMTDAAPGTLATRLPRLAVNDAGRTADRIAGLVSDPPDLSTEIAAHLGDLTPGAATTAFLAAVDEVIRQRDVARAEGARS